MKGNDVAQRGGRIETYSAQNRRRQRQVIDPQGGSDGTDEIALDPFWDGWPLPGIAGIAGSAWKEELRPEKE